MLGSFGNRANTQPDDATQCSKRWYFFAVPGNINEATSYYVETIERAGHLAGFSLERVTSLSAIPRGGRVLAIDCNAATKVMLRRPDCRCWLWVQGVVPEETEFLVGSKLRKALWTLRERLAIPRARGLILVSQAMHDHYVSKYGMQLNPIIMPCVNQKLDPSAFRVPKKYERPSFVYAGGMHKWQCFELTLEVFQQVQSSLPHATLTVLSSDDITARAIVDRSGVRNVTVGKVPLDQLQLALSDHKYGFVLRREHVINTVATPTKTSSYMAAGIIPITTAAVRDFTARLRPLKHTIVSDSVCSTDIAKTILEFEQRQLEPLSIEAEYSQLFADYFEHDAYIPRLAHYLRESGLSGTNGGLDAAPTAGAR